MHTIKKLIILSLAPFITGCNDSGHSKIFDVHLHGSPSVEEQMEDLKTNGVYKAAVSTSWSLQQSYADSEGLQILQGLMLPCPGGRVPYSRQQCFSDGAEWPSPEWVESLMQEKKIDFLGEVLTQYYGISSSDTLMYPYYLLAEKYTIPVGLHTGSAGPDHGCPNFKEVMGNPTLLKETLNRFPKLKVWIMHAGLPFYNETVQMMKEYPHLYLDISAINNPDILKPEIFSKTIKGLIDEGFEDRIMFGSDNGDIRLMINSVTSLPFLSHEQKENILYKNAERFFQTPAR